MRKGPLKIAAEQSGRVSALEPLARTGSAVLPGKGTLGGPHLLGAPQFCPFGVFYAWIEEIGMAEDKGICLLFGSKGGLELADVGLAYFQWGSVQMFSAKCFVPPALSFLNLWDSQLFPVAEF